MNNFSVKFFLKNFPVTSGVFVINILIFLLNHSKLIPVVAIYPGDLSLYTFFAHFSHISLMHIAFNMLVLLQISPLIEQKIRGFSYVSLILSLWILLSIGGFFFTSAPTLGFSGIGLGLITFCGLLYRRAPQFSKQILTWAAVNVAIGLLPGISFLMHFLGAVLGAALFYFLQLFRRV